MKSFKRNQLRLGGGGKRADYVSQISKKFLEKRREKSNENKMKNENEATGIQIIIGMYFNWWHIQAYTLYTLRTVGLTLGSGEFND